MAGREPQSASYRNNNLLDEAQHALKNFQDGPKMARPNLAESFIPVVGPAWEAAADLQDGNYGGAAFNGAMAVADALPIGVGIKGLRAASKGIWALKAGRVTAGAAAAQLRRKGLAVAGEEIHHSIPLNGLSRSVEDWRNHYAFLKVLPKEVHRRLHGRFNGNPQFGLLGELWHGTTDWQKAVPAGVAGYAADSWENLTRPFGAAPGQGAEGPDQDQ